ncbi:MAG: cysteine-rich CWC family protein [Burkholderiaceae bacterium]|nr:cysteine-rich CWC family protein [Burkholderiaceae bacterium]
MSHCSRCGQPFSCGMRDEHAAQPCWCTQLPKLPLAQLPTGDQPGQASCLCPECLQAWVAQMQAQAAQ